MESEFCDCTRNIKLPGKPLMDELSTLMTSQPYHDSFIDIGRIKLNRKKQKEGVYALKSLCNDNSYNKLKSIFAGAAISGLFAIFHDGTDYFRIKNIPDNVESREITTTVATTFPHATQNSVSTPPVPLFCVCCNNCPFRSSSSSNFVS
jgi:hypothetical protein